MADTSTEIAPIANNDKTNFQKTFERMPHFIHRVIFFPSETRQTLF